jgi:hypothetical protein
MNKIITKNTVAVFLLQICVLTVLAGCQAQNAQEKTQTPNPAADAAAAPDPGGYPENPTGNVWNPDKAEAVPYYEIPQGWEVNPASKWTLRNSVAGQETSYLSLEIPEMQTSPEAARDAGYDQTVCQDGVNQNSFIDCRITPQKSEVEMSGQKVYLLTYWGTWRGMDKKVQLFYFLHDGTVYSAKVEGNASDAATAVEKIIATLTFQEELFTPQSNSDERGGI